MREDGALRRANLAAAREATRRGHVLSLRVTQSRLARERLAGGFADKLPVFDLFWPDDQKAVWFGWVEWIVAIANAPEPPLEPQPRLSPPSSAYISPMARFYEVAVEVEGRRYVGDWTLMQGGRVCVRSAFGSEAADLGTERPERVAPRVLERIVRANTLRAGR